ncbi:DUF438 domain-containing protein [uncultured Veillonella sp.]|uniref:DUF438 domain-containing protein n=1 Tax=uncultured Veillonella sp. TaxID=159268 RepID=UPI0025E6E4B4|nr:DUF438 domain-containing protein [uncultured Veillonella sp.]
MATMKSTLGLENDVRLETMIDIKDKYLSGELTLEAARQLLKEHIGTCTPDEFAYGEQQLKGSYTDEEITHRMDDLLELFDGILVRSENDYPMYHPLWVYVEEIKAGLQRMEQADELLTAKHFIKNPWLGLYDELTQWFLHLSRKQNQLYPALEKYGFDRPTKIMWTFDDKVRDLLKESVRLLQADQVDEFLALQPKMIDAFRDLCDKEQEVLFPTAIKLCSEEDFVYMSRGDHEIGFALITPPPFYEAPAATHTQTTHALASNRETTNENAVSGDEINRNTVNGGTINTTAPQASQEANFISELAALLGKYNINPTSTNLSDNQSGLANSGSAAQVHAKASTANGTLLIDRDADLDVATGKLSLNRINLLFQHMPVDLSYVDENELVKFYSDTKHRIFPRSANVIGREVRNCHPAKSVHLVEEIIEKFRSGEQDKAEFWINKPEAFIYILYTAVRDEQGTFKGVLEMMQDCTRIRSLEGSRTLLTWDNEVHGDTSNSVSSDEATETEALNTTKDSTTEMNSKESSTQHNNTEQQSNNISQGINNTNTLTVKGITLTPDTKLFELFDQVEGLRQHMPQINSSFSMLNTTFGKIMAKKATLQKAADRTGMNLETLMQAVAKYIEMHHIK